MDRKNTGKGQWVKGRKSHHLRLLYIYCEYSNSVEIQYITALLPCMRFSPFSLSSFSVCCCRNI